MPKQDFVKRMGQIYALAIQHGLSEQELNKYVEDKFSFLYNKKKQQEYREKVATGGTYGG